MTKIERERKFYISAGVIGVVWDKFEHSDFSITQGYLCMDAKREVRIRTSIDHYAPSSHRTYAEVTIKTGSGELREETSYPVDYDLASLAVTKLPHISKARYLIGDGWELDVFINLHPLVLLERELEPDEELPPFPEWLKNYVILDVTHDETYKNKNLAK